MTYLHLVLPLLLLLGGKHTATSSPSPSPYFAEWLKRLDLPMSKETVSAAKSALIVVDMQNDFVAEYAYGPADVHSSPCSAYFASVGSPKNISCFGVKEGDVTAGAIASLLQQHRFETVIASMDDHSPDHCSFASAADQAVTAGAPNGCAAELATCDAEAFHGCAGTKHATAAAAGNPLAGPFPPHCVRGRRGTEFYAPVRESLAAYADAEPVGGVHVAIKGLDTTTDSFGVLPYSEGSWKFYDDAGLFGPGPSAAPAALIRSMLTWEKHMANSTGGAAFLSPFSGAGYAQPPPFSTMGDAGELRKSGAAEMIASHGNGVETILVTGLALDWCVLDTALNARALMPDKRVAIVLDAARPSFLPKGPAAAPYLKANAEGEQCYTDPDGAGTGCWLHDPKDVAKVLTAARVDLITSDQVVDAFA